MKRSNVRRAAAALLGGLLAAGPVLADDDEGLGFELTPPRLSFTDGEVSFWRAGADDWAPARMNTPLAVGDELYTASEANLELQVAARAYVRAGEETQLGLTNLEPDYLQLRVTAGHVSLDLRSLKAGQTFELATPNAAFTIERTGYYRVAVDDKTTTLTSRRGGRATLTLASGDSVSVAASEQVVVSGSGAPQVESYAAPELDAWDRWNYARTDSQLETVSARYVPSDVYGAADLDQYGDWRVVPTYGPLWVPRGVPVGWVPYSTGRWVYDPHYSWTWVDDSPWGWAPYHYGRWVHVSGYWGWAPGPLVVRPYYAPALVAFFGNGSFSIGISLGTPHLGWVALGWGEPLVPWWGPARYRSAPRWAGWAGPRIVNDVVVVKKTVINVRDINRYRNARVSNAIVAVDRDRFGRGPVAKARVARVSAERYRPLHGELSVKADRRSLVVAEGVAKRPSRAVVQREVVARRAPKAPEMPGLEPGRKTRAEREDLPRAAPPARVVPQDRQGRRVSVSDRPPFARRGEDERRPGPPAPRFRDLERGASSEPVARAERTQGVPRETPPVAAAPRQRRSEQPRAEAPPAQRPAVQKRQARQEAVEPPREAKPRQERRERIESPQAAPPRRAEASAPERRLPGEPANRVYRPRRDSTPRDVGSAPPRASGEQRSGQSPGRGGGRVVGRRSR